MARLPARVGVDERGAGDSLRLEVADFLALDVLRLAGDDLVFLAGDLLLLLLFFAGDLLRLRVEDEEEDATSTIVAEDMEEQLEPHQARRAHVNTDMINEAAKKQMDPQTTLGTGQCCHAARSSMGREIHAIQFPTNRAGRLTANWQAAPLARNLASAKRKFH